MKSFSDPDTHFEIVKSQTPVTVDGFALHEPTGEIRCEECGRSHHVVEEIPHEKDCPQRGVVSRFWEREFVDYGSD